jgi:hypothetical protein
MDGARCERGQSQLTYDRAGGWGNSVMQNEPLFIALDGCMVIIATLIQTALHPGYCFPRLSSGYVVTESRLPAVVAEEGVVESKTPPSPPVEDSSVHMKQKS